MHVSLPALPMIVDNDGLGVWFLSYVNGLGTYLLRYLEVKSAHPLSLDLFWLLDLSTSWLILVSDSDSYSYYTVCLLFTSFVFLTQSSTTLTRLVDVRSVYTWFAIYIPCLFDSFLSARLTDHWSFVSLSTLLTLSTWLSHLVLLVESTLSLLDLFVTRSSSCLLDFLVCLTHYIYDSLCLWPTLSTVTHLVNLTFSAWLACLLNLLIYHNCLFILLCLHPLDLLVCFLSTWLTCPDLFICLTHSVCLNYFVYYSHWSDLLLLSDYLVYLTHLVCLIFSVCLTTSSIWLTLSAWLTGLLDLLCLLDSPVYISHWSAWPSLSATPLRLLDSLVYLTLTPTWLARLFDSPCLLDSVVGWLPLSAWHMSITCPSTLFSSRPLD